MFIVACWPFGIETIERNPMSTPRRSRFRELSGGQDRSSRYSSSKLETIASDAARMPFGLPRVSRTDRSSVQS
jgi:hypothetical protein